MVDTFICPECGKEAVRARHNKMYCRECVQKREKARARERSYQRLQEEKETHALKAAAYETEKYENKMLKERLANDARIDARSRKQIKKQCQFCKYQLRQGGNCENRCIGCDHVSHTGKLRDRGNGPGDCRSFVPLTTETKEERIARRRKAITISEADHAKNTGEKMREVNLL